MKTPSITLLTAILAFLTVSATADDKIQELYNAKCAACHISGVAGAPKLDDKDAWAPRLEKGVDGLLATAKSGIGAMPPMGTCSECSDDDLTALIEYMIANVR